MKYIFTSSLLLISMLAAAQTIDRQVIGSIGFQVDDLDFRINQTIGEAIIGHTSSSEITLTQGFIQVFESPVLSNNFEDLFGNLFIFPNPANHYLNIHNLPAVDLKGKIIDLQGKTVWTGEATRTIETIGLAPGQYILTLFDDAYNFKNFTVIIAHP